MTAEGAHQHSRPRWFLRLLVLAVAAVVLFLAVTAVQIVHTASLEELHSADAIVVFGAAEYAGRPSPVLRARLDHALNLFQRGVAPVVITTGGAAADPQFSEGGVGQDYLMRRGVPERNLIAETQGRDTSGSAARVAVIMHANGLRSCVAVSDAYHVFRIRNFWSTRASRRSMWRRVRSRGREQRGNAKSRCCARLPVICCGEWESDKSAGVGPIREKSRFLALLGMKSATYQPSRCRSAVMWATW